MTDCGLTADGGQRIYVTGVTGKKARPLAEKLEATGLVLVRAQGLGLRPRVRRAGAFEAPALSFSSA
jgi:hypothetical protein